ncbi:SUF system NifU family Fe-S cluster assembly protein [Candidatus Uhrbacteria bacterium]|nr:SUF system NifU family Fe-S cluster assembly protein [Candidatus Uhrbacteria bacterium]
MSDDLYKQEILDHYWNPHNAGTLHGATVSAKEVNTSCGDSVVMDLIITNDRVSDVRFQGQGCAISQASTSMLTDKIKGMDAAQAKNLSEKDILEMLGITVGPARMKCATLGLMTLKKALNDRVPDSSRQVLDANNRTAAATSRT